MAHHRWILFLDADEEVSPELRAEILAEFESGTESYVGYEFPRMVYYLGRWIRHGEWYPDLKLRLFQKEKGHSAGREPHDHVVVEGPVKRLESPVYHYTYNNICEHIETMNRFTTITAQEKYAEGVRFRWRDFLIRPFWRFLKAYVLRQGFRDGRRGLLIACVSSFSVALKYAKLWEIELQEEGRAEDPV
jgi:hypothetical protein